MLFFLTRNCNFNLILKKFYYMYNNKIKLNRNKKKYRKKNKIHGIWFNIN